LWGVVCAVAVSLGRPGDARAFCGFYVSGADAKLFNNATQVVMMREGTRTVLSMQNNYQGPPENFALVIPVPVILQKENVKTLPREIFDKVDTLTAPRLVEYWEQDPCAAEVLEERAMKMMAAAPMAAAPAGAGGGYGVKIEAQFTVGEYEIVILSAQNSTGLDAWLRDNNYKIPAGAEPYLRPYVQKGSKFFVAKVNVQKVKFERIGNGPEQAVLSPLRFHYDSDSFDLPIRLGLINSGGAQDLIVNILGRGQRYDVANYPNVTIPTNLDVTDGTKDSFAPFYTALFDRTLDTHRRAVVTEYAWDASSCDPCPTPGLTPSELMTLGADALPSAAAPVAPSPVPKPRGGVQLASFLREDVPEIGLQRGGATGAAPSATAAPNATGAAPNATTTGAAPNAMPSGPAPSAVPSAGAPAAKPKSGNCALSPSDGALTPAVIISVISFSFVGRRRTRHERRAKKSGR
jgi:hypothetical protein